MVICYRLLVDAHWPAWRHSAKAKLLLTTQPQSFFPGLNMDVPLGRQ
ncbi:hypothetical protein BVRB_7g179030 [Beta vulgaris subsp. vulgaris]|uniref:Uncharacterized protein n=1 Tax=Beta vulgaris subsp. vulgaris TaxID=3555 RepID=A0A0J8BAS4_BETVV|nr:hypothetical protein BVRB_7g179030 [Beta vulgaris subsp. vulgaris]